MSIDSPHAILACLVRASLPYSTLPALPVRKLVQADRPSQGEAPEECTRHAWQNCTDIPPQALRESLNSLSFSEAGR